MQNNLKIIPEGDSSILMVFGNEVNPEINRKISAVVQLIKSQHIEGLVDMIPSYCALLINYNPLVLPYEKARERLERLAQIDLGGAAGAKRVFEIPVCYGGDFGPDMQNICDHSGLSEAEVIELHSSRDYLIYMLGFLPGFCYLGGLDEKLHTPRLASPRLQIPAGSVGIGGSATGIYPMDSPGGWQLMGKTPVRTYDPDRAVPILVSAGDYIRFVPVDEAEFHRIKDLVDHGQYEVTVREEKG